MVCHVPGTGTEAMPDHEFEERISSRLLDVLIRAGLILALVILCYRVFAPFLVMMEWAVILCVTLYPLHQALAREEMVVHFQPLQDLRSRRIHGVGPW